MAVKNKMLSPSPVKAAGTPSLSPSQMEEDRRYRAQNALRTITEAEGMKRDKALMKDVKQLVVAGMKAVSGSGKK